MWHLKNNRGVGALLSIAIIGIIMIFAMCLTALLSFESKSNVRSEKSTTALYLADAGVERALFEFNRSTGPYTFSGAETYLPDGSNPQGTFVVSISSSPSLPNRWVVQADGYVPNSATPRFVRKVQAVCTGSGGDSITITSALMADGDIDIGGTADISGGTLAGATRPAGHSYSRGGSSTVTGTPASTTAPFPTFQEIFGITSAQMQNRATTTYTNPPNNSAATGITWSNGDLQCSSGWNGSGILVVNGDFKMTGGTFSGVIYVTGDLDMTGGNMAGGIFVEGDIDVRGNTQIDYTSAAETIAEDQLATSYDIASWEEIL